MPDAYDVLAVRPETECFGWRFHRASTSTISNGRMIQEGPWCRCGKSWHDHTKVERDRVPPAVSYESMATLLGRLVYLLAASEGDHAEGQSTRQGEVLEQFFATLHPYEAHLVRQHHANLSRSLDIAVGRDQPSSSTPASPLSPPPTPSPPPPFQSDSSSSQPASASSSAPTSPPPSLSDPSSSPPMSTSTSSSTSSPPPSPTFPSDFEGQEQDGSESPFEVPEPLEPTSGTPEGSEGSTGPSEQTVTPPTPRSAPRKAARPTKKASKR